MAEGCVLDTHGRMLGKHPVFSAIVLAIAIRAILSPFLTYDFDVYHWGIIIENFQSGNGLYDVAGYYYTPVWGYMLGVFSCIQDMFLNLNTFGCKIIGLIPMEQLAVPYHMSIITTISFNISMKIPLIICDALVAGILYWIIREFTKDDRKAFLGMIFWLFCPTVIYMSGVQVQFDTFSALFFLITVILLYKDQNLLAGMMLSISILLKFFPAFCVLVLIGYTIAKHRGDGTVVNRLVKSALGAGIIALAIMLPVMLEGNLEDSLSFILGRAGTSTNIAISIQSWIGSAIALVGMVAFGIRMARCNENHDRMLFQNILFSLSFAMMMSTTPQYMIVMLPFLILELMAYDDRLTTCLILISTGSFISAIMYNNFSLLSSLSAYTQIVSESTVVHLSQLLESCMVLGMNLVDFVNVIGNVINLIGLTLMFLIALNSLMVNRTTIVEKLLERIFRGRPHEA